MPELRSVPRARDLANHLAEFITALAKAGYAAKTQHDKQRLIAPFVTGPPTESDPLFSL